MTKKLSTLLRAISVVPLSSRAIALVGLALYLILGPSRTEDDIVATVLGYSILAIISLLMVCAIIQRRLLKGRLALDLRVEPLQGFSSSSNVAGREDPVLRSHTPSRIVGQVHELRLLPLFSLSLQLSPNPPHIPAIVHVLTGRKREQQIIEDCSFPHRGRWRFAKATVMLQDFLGLTRAVWSEETAAKDAVFVVLPPLLHESQVPIVSSEQRAGEDVHHPRERHGDPYDLKQYHPSDGMRKIVWKTYAKSRQLLSRHPEPTMTPEGKVVAIVVAREEDDFTCSQAVAYARKVEAAGLEVSVSYEAQGPSEPAVTSDRLELLVSDFEPIPNPDERLHANLSRALGAYSSTLAHVVIFLEAGRLASATFERAIQDFAQNLSDRGVTPLFVIVSGKQTTLHPEVPYLRAAERLLLNTPPSDAGPSDEELVRRFSSVCAGRSWEVIIEKPWLAA